MTFCHCFGKLSQTGAGGGKGNGVLCGGADGNFGGETETAVLAYQHKHGLQEDGKAGPETMSHILGVA